MLEMVGVRFISTLNQTLSVYELLIFSEIVVGIRSRGAEGRKWMRVKYLGLRTRPFAAWHEP